MHRLLQGQGDKVMVTSIAAPRMPYRTALLAAMLAGQSSAWQPPPPPAPVSRTLGRETTGHLPHAHSSDCPSWWYSMNPYHLGARAQAAAGDRAVLWAIRQANLNAGTRSSRGHTAGNWTNDGSTDPCLTPWDGVACNSAGRVTYLQLCCDLTVLPAVVSELSELRHLILDRNALETVRRHFSFYLDTPPCAMHAASHCRH